MAETAVSLTLISNYVPDFCRRCRMRISGGGLGALGTPEIIIQDRGAVDGGAQK
jgi:hypothetical protein